MGELQEKFAVMGKSCRHWCNTPHSLHVSCAIEVNNHISAKCAECGKGFME